MQKSFDDELAQYTRESSSLDQLTLRCAEKVTAQGIWVFGGVMCQ